MPRRQRTTEFLDDVPAKRQRRRAAKADIRKYDIQAKLERQQAGPQAPKASNLPLVAKNENQGAYISSIICNILTFGLGPAGVGKTYIATRMAAAMLRDGQIKKLILTRPAVEAGVKMGFLPGTKEEKFMPFMRPYLDVLNKELGQGFVEYALKAGTIEIAPLAYLRGWTFEDCVVVLDEAQNTTPVEMKMFLTRIGERVKIVVNGDAEQQDIPGVCGLIDGVHKARGLSGVGVITFTVADIVRSGLVQQLVERYARRQPSEPMESMLAGGFYD